MSTILVIHEDPAGAESILAPRLTDDTLVYAAVPDEIEPALAKYKPELVFSCKGPTLPGPEMRAALTFPSVRMMYVGGSGYDHLLPFTNTNAIVTNAAGVLSRYLAETVLGAMLTLNGNFLTYANQARQREWRRIAFAPLAGRTLLIVGLGHIGAWVADFARTFNMQVLATRRRAEPHPSVDEMHPPEALAQLLPRADFVSVHVRLSDETHHMFNADAFAQMRAGAFFVNTSRGPVVDEQALFDALSHKRLRGAYLDVFEQEPLPAESPLWDLDNLLITPHAADNIQGWRERFLEHFAENVWRYHAGEPLRNIVHKPQ